MPSTSPNNDFRLTASALRGDQARGRRAAVRVVAFSIVIGAVAVWMTWARVPLYAVSTHARLQTRDEVYPVDALVAGRIESVRLPVGGAVRAGDIVLALDATDAELRLEDARGTLHGLTAQISALESELAARDDGLESTERLGVASRSEARASRREIQAEAGYASREHQRVEQMHQAGVVASAEADRAAATQQQTAAAVAVRDQRLSVLDNQLRRELADRRAEQAALRRAREELVAARDAAAVQVKRLEVELARHVVRAPVDGVLGQVTAPQPGSVVAVGQTVAVVTPNTALVVVADFPPAAVVGRVRAGQPARMRVTGFPWTQFGVLEARVSAVSSEPRDDRIRVVLELDEPCATAIPRQHGLTGEVEIELARVSPATLLARTVGQWLDRSDSP